MTGITSEKTYQTQIQTQKIAPLFCQPQQEIVHGVSDPKLISSYSTLSGALSFDNAGGKGSKTSKSRAPKNNFYIAVPPMSEELAKALGRRSAKARRRTGSGKLKTLG
jgi:hypothetical protein